MATALPPELDGPITPASKQVYVDNLLPQSLVTVYADNVKVGTATSTNPGGIWVPLTVTLVEKKPPQEIAATQNYQGKNPDYAVTSGESGRSNSVPVLPVPNPLPPPVFLSGLSPCMDSIVIGGLIPGTELAVSVGGSTLVKSAVDQPTQWFSLLPVATPETSILTAQQTLGANMSPIALSPPVPAAPTSLGVPVIATPVRACQTTVDLSNMTPGAHFKLTNNATVTYGLNEWPSYTYDGLPPLQPGTLTVEQSFTRCQVAPASSKPVPVAASPLPFPIVTYAACRDVKQLFVSNLLGGEVLVLKRVVTGKTNTESTIGSQGVSGSTATVFLPNSFQPTDPGGAVSIRIEVLLCGAALPPPGYVSVAIAAVGGPYPAPTVPAPLYQCGRSVPVQGAHPGSIIQIFSGSTAIPRSNPVVAAAPDLTVGLWTPLAKSESIFAQQTGCNANGSSMHVGVLGLPSSLPAPGIVPPVRPGATAIKLTNVLPGAQVFLSVNDLLRTEMEATATTISMPTGSPLTNQETIEVMQTLCTEKSGTSRTEVLIGQLNVVSTPYDLIRTEANLLTVSTNDADEPTFTPVNGLPVTVSTGFSGGKPTGPSVSGVTGTALKYTPGASDKVAVAFVTGVPGYEDAQLTIPLVDPLKVWVGNVGTTSAVVYGQGFPTNTCEVTVDGMGLIPTKHFVGDIVKGITVSVSCENMGESWTFHVQSTSGGPTVNGTINCVGGTP